MRDRVKKNSFLSPLRTEQGEPELRVCEYEGPGAVALAAGRVLLVLESGVGKVLAQDVGARQVLGDARLVLGAAAAHLSHSRRRG